MLEEFLLAYPWLLSVWTKEPCQPMGARMKGNLRRAFGMFIPSVLLSARFMDENL